MTRNPSDFIKNLIISKPFGDICHIPSLINTKFIKTLEINDNIQTIL